MKLTASILLVLIISSSLFYYGYFDAMLLRSKEKAAESVSAAEQNHTLRLFKIPVNQQDKYSDDELWINGNLYDVGERKIINDTIYLSLYHDADEEGILAEISNFFNPDDNGYIVLNTNTPLLKSVRIIPNPQYTFETLPLRLQVNATAYIRFSKNSGNTAFPFYDIITPPPRMS